MAVIVQLQGPYGNEDFSGYGLSLQNINALDRLGDGSWVFSVVWWQGFRTSGQLVTLDPANLYRVGGNAVGVEEVLRGSLLGFANIDAADVLPDGRIGVSGVYDGLVWTPAGRLRLSSDRVYVRNTDGTIVESVRLPGMYVPIDAVTLVEEEAPQP